MADVHFKEGGIDLKIPCGTILDLIPLVKDGVASKESVQLVQDHIQTCDRCRIDYEAFENLVQESFSIKDEKILAAIKRSLYISHIILLLVGAIVGVALSNSMGMFYNLMIMPIIGGVSFITLKRKWFIAPSVIFLLAIIWQTLAGFINYGSLRDAFYDGIYFSIIYTILSGLGVVIAILLKFAFKKER